MSAIDEPCGSKIPFKARITEGVCQLTHSCRHTAAVRAADLKKKSIFNSLTLWHTQAFLRSNRLTPFLWLWCPFCVSSRTTMAKGEKNKKTPNRDVSMWALLNLQQVVHFVTTNKER